MLPLLLACVLDPSESLERGWLPGSDPAEVVDSVWPAFEDTGPYDVAVERVSRTAWGPNLRLVAPVEGTVSHGFGPRLLDGEDDFHLGVDYPAPTGTPVVAVAPGVVHRVWKAGEHSDSSMLIVAHALTEPIRFHGERIESFYAVYLHLSAFEVEEGDVVARGQPIGATGDVGARTEHLHFELRLGTWCSARWAEEHPESSCAQRYDPAINPLHAVPGRVEQPPLAGFTDSDGRVVEITTAPGDADWNRLETPEGVLDFDLRQGIDARSWESLDTLDYGWVAIEPHARGVDGGQRWTLTFEHSPDWVQVTDISGEGYLLRPQ